MATKRKATGIKKQTFRSAYDLGDYDFSETFDKNGLTEQHHKDSCDINFILAQFQATGIAPHMNNNEQYGDQSEFNYQEMQNQLAEAKSLFEELPEQVKSEFNYDMKSFLNFAEKPDNLPQMEEWGLALKNERLAQALETEAGKETPQASLSAGKSDDKSDAAEGLST
jgi:hypothetical protein